MNKKVLHALYLGVLCSVSYLAVYLARNILSAVTPQMIEGGKYTAEYIGSASSAFFVCYAIGQLINGAIGDKIKARYMISVGLLMAGVSNFVFSVLPAQSVSAIISYGFTGIFLSMIYGPMTKVVSENVDYIYVPRCSLGYTFASFFGSPLAGVIAAFFVWKKVFAISSFALGVMAVIAFLGFIILEKNGIVKYNQFDRKKGESGRISILLKHRIIKFTLVSILTGVIRTTVVFWMPTYFSQYLGYSPDTTALIFTVSTLAISLSAFIAIFVYEKLKRNMDLTLFLMFLFSAIFFVLLFLIKSPVINITLMVLAIIAANSAATMLWSIYCPSLRNTGMVSGATGFLDFVSYIAAAISSTVFSNAVSSIGWGNLILVWAGLMAIGTVISIPKKKARKE